MALLRTVAGRHSHRELRALAEAHKRLAQGIADRHRFATAEAAAVLQAAGRELSRNGSPAAVLAEYHRAMAVYHADRYREAALLLAAVRRAAAKLDEPLLDGLSAKALGLIAQTTGHPDAAADLYRAALASVRRSGDVRESVNVAAVLADGLLAAGNDKEAWAVLHGALHQAWQQPDAFPRYMAGAAGAAMAEKRGFPQLAVKMTQLSLAALESDSGAPAAIADATTWYASSLLAVGRFADASAVLRPIRPVIAQVHDPASWRRARADLELAEGRQLLTEGNAAAALPRLRSAAAYYEDAQLLVHAASSRAAQGVAASALGDRIQARALLERSLVLATRLDGFLPRPETYYGSADPTASLMETVLSLDVRRGAAWEGLRMAALALRRHFPHTESSQPTARSLQDAAARLRGRGRVVLVVYSLPHGIVTWRLDGRSLRMRRAVVEQTAVSIAVQRFIVDARRDRERGPDASRRAAALSALLFGDLLRDVPEGTPIVIVSTPELAAVPWAFLEGPDTAGQLIAKWPVAIAPDLETALAEEAPIPIAAAGLLVVAAPTLTGDAHRRLVEAESEAGQLLALFRGRASALLGPRATKQLVVDGIPRFASVHMGVHGISDPQSPRASHLVLGSAEGRPDLLTADEILRLDLRRTRLVVLAACDSSFRSTALATNAFGLGEAFLAAGARTVVASGWAVDDAATSKLMGSFYRRLAGGTAVAEALRGAQLEQMSQLETSLAPDYAAFRVLGDPGTTLRGREE
ncbi:MAG TPA: CHAT domain-containing protein [Thermoanaerobaculia bacterium]|nr:CHAT domain-containing protein [Thermoanaerobaculia bacterium]